MRFDSHSVRQSTSTGVAAASRKRRRKIARRLDGVPIRAAARAMSRDARRHFLIAAPPPSRHRPTAAPWRRQGRNQALRIAALARASAADDEGEFRYA